MQKFRTKGVVLIVVKKTEALANSSKSQENVSNQFLTRNFTFNTEVIWSLFTKNELHLNS